MSSNYKESQPRTVDDEDGLEGKAVKHLSESQTAVTTALTKVQVLLAQQYCEELLRKKRRENCA